MTLDMAAHCKVNDKRSKWPVISAIWLGPGGGRGEEGEGRGREREREGERGEGGRGGREGEGEEGISVYVHPNRWCTTLRARQARFLQRKLILT